MVFCRSIVVLMFGHAKDRIRVLEVLLVCQKRLSNFRCNKICGYPNVQYASGRGGICQKNRFTMAAAAYRAVFWVLSNLYCVGLCLSLSGAMNILL